MSSLKLDKLKRTELEDLLKSLKFYREAKSKLWNRWKKIFNRVYNWKSSYKVEYFPKMEEKDVWAEAKKIFKKSFSETIKKEDVEFIKNEKLLWWIVVYKNDDIVDLSFSKVKKDLTGSEI